MLHQLFPKADPLELTLYTASGWNATKGQYKASLHAIWPQLVVTRERANVVRRTTVEQFEKRSANNGPLHPLLERLVLVS